MKEWDIDSYVRKYDKTQTVFKKETGELFSMYVAAIDIQHDEDNNDITIRWKDEKGNFHTNLNPVYYPFQSRLYKNGNCVVALIRNIKKSWKIGLNSDNYKIIVLDGIFKLHLFKPLEPLVVDKQKALETKGPISDRLYISEKCVYFMAKEVGYRKGSRFTVDSSIWQEVSDALRDHQCSITK
jgi:hypothetical protein